MSEIKLYGISRSRAGRCVFGHRVELARVSVTADPNPVGKSSFHTGTTTARRLPSLLQKTHRFGPMLERFAYPSPNVVSGSQTAPWLGAMRKRSRPLRTSEGVQGDRSLMKRTH